MTSVHFEFLSKENVGSAATLKSRGVTNQKELQENFVTPRRALGDVNKNLLTGQTPLSKAFGFGDLNTEKESCKKKKNRRVLASISENEMKQDFKPKKSFDKQVKSSLLTSKNLHAHDDIEKAHRPPQKNDDYEDIWPKKERVSSYLDKLLNWKPSCFQIWKNSEESDSDHVISDNEELPTLSETGDIFEKALYSNEINCLQPEVENIILPDVDELFLLSDTDEES